MDLYQAFGLTPGSIVAAVGGGGKTSLVFALAGQAASRGITSLVTTTTKFTKPPVETMPPIIETSDGNAASDLHALPAHEPVVAVTGYGDHGRMLGFKPETFSGLSQLNIGLIAIEADGSAHRQFKAPAEHEPVIPPVATDVVVCVGLDVFGKPLDDRFVHRSEIVAALAHATPGEPVTPAIVLDVLLSADGGRKNVPAAARVHVLLNGPADEERDKLATYIAQRAVFSGYCRGVLASAHTGEVRAVIQ